MAHQIVPHFCNDAGVETVRIGAKEFMCIGARPPFDHPHVFLDMGGDTEAVCPYCSTRFVFDPSLGEAAAEPADCVYHSEAAE